MSFSKSLPVYTRPHSYEKTIICNELCGFKTYFVSGVDFYLILQAIGQKCVANIREVCGECVIFALACVESEGVVEESDVYLIPAPWPSRRRHCYCHIRVLGQIVTW